MQLNKKTKIFIAGHKGMVGSAVLRCFKDKGYKNLITAGKNKLNLLNQKETENFFIKKSDYIAKVLCMHSILIKFYEVSTYF